MTSKRQSQKLELSPGTWPGEPRRLDAAEKRRRRQEPQQLDSETRPGRISDLTSPMATGPPASCPARLQGHPTPATPAARRRPSPLVQKAVTPRAELSQPAHRSSAAKLAASSNDNGSTRPTAQQAQGRHRLPKAASTLPKMLRPGKASCRTRSTRLRRRSALNQQARRSA